MNRDPLNVLLTVDTELSPSRGAGTPLALRHNLASSIYGTPAGEYGLPFQLDCLRRRELKAVFFVEALFPIVAGIRPLQEIVDLVRQADQEVQLHVHTEWLDAAAWNPLGNRTGQNMSEFSESEQSTIISTAKEYLEQCGVPEVSAFRAGNYGANNDTFKSLARNDLRFDSSYNYTYLDRQCHIHAPAMLTRATPMDGIWEIPVTHFQDRPGNYRHAQLCACSFRELSSMLMQAYADGMETFVIVAHSFELINRERTGHNKLHVDRFRRLCRFLSERRDQFATVGFDDLQPQRGDQHPPLTSAVWRTAERMTQQLVGRLYE